MADLSGKTAVISGAAGGMGQVACEQFCEDGARVIGVDIDEATGGELQERLSAAGHDFTFHAGSVFSPEDIEGLVAVVRDSFGHLDILYNNAGVVLGKPVLETTEEEWDLVHNVTLKGTFMMTKALVPLMGPGGSIINVSSTGGLVGFEFMSAYCAAKGGVALFTKSCAMDLAPDIRVNAICPGVIDTPMPRAFVSKLSDDEAKEVWSNFEEGHLLKRVGRPEEVVAMARMLASDDASFITGAALPVDGGWTAQ
jgi:NAD(P)-dependent dehydrogenase (short-subunit alcohol dehydrogenase family)